MADPIPTSPNAPKDQEEAPSVIPAKTPEAKRQEVQEEPSQPLKIPTIEEREGIKEKAKKERKPTQTPSAESLLEAQRINQEMKEKAKTYFAGLETIPKLEEIEQLQAKAESDDVDLIDLRGGHKWLGIKEKDYKERPELRHIKLSQIYLNKELDTETGQIIFTVKKSLDNVYKVKFGLGAGHILPPSIQHIEITDLNGNTRQGTREIRDGKVGYYDTTGYMQIFGGYKIRPLKMIKEGSDKYKQALEAEEQNFQHERENANIAQIDYPDNTAYFGESPNPIVNLKALRKPIPKKTADSLDKKTLEKFTASRKDLNRIEAILGNFSLRMSSQSEVDGGLYLTKLGGKGAQMLGWNSEIETSQKNLFQSVSTILETWNKEKNTEKTTTALKEKGITFKLDTSEDKGYKLFDDTTEITNLENWTTQKSVASIEPNETIKLLRAMQNGGIYRYMDEEFMGNYDLTLSHLDTIHNYATKDQKRLKEVLIQARKGGKVDAKKVVEILMTPEVPKNIDNGMSWDEINKYIMSNRANLGYLLGDDNWISLLKRFNKPNARPIPKINYRWDAMHKMPDYPHRGGSSCCAYAASTFLGLGNANRHVPRDGKSAGVQALISRLIQDNLRKSKREKTGIVFGFENFRKGDAIVFKGGPRYAPHSYAHVAVIRFKQKLPIYDSRGTYIGEEEYIGIIDDGGALQGTILPVNRNSRTYRYLRNILSNPSRRAWYFQKHPELIDVKGIFEERNTVRIRANAGWWGDGSKSANGRIAFGVHTDTLL